MIRPKYLVLAASTVLLQGCGSEGGRRAVSGAVTFRGRPVEQGSVTFLSGGPPPAPVGGAMIRGGRFDIPAEHGLEPGTYRVAVSCPEPGGSLTPAEMAAGASPKARESIPAKFNAETTLSVEVKPRGENRFEFALD